MSWLVKLDADLIRQIIIQAATFLAFFLVVKVFFADKIKKILDERQNAIEQEIDEAAEANQNAKALETEYAELMKGAKDEKAEILHAANEDGEKIREQIVADAHAEAAGILDTARKQIDRERTQAEKDLKDSVVDMAITAAEAISGKTLTEADQQALIDEAISSIKEG